MGKKRNKKIGVKKSRQKIVFPSVGKDRAFIRPGAKQRIFLLLRKMSCLAAVISVGGKKKTCAIKKYHTPMHVAARWENRVKTSFDYYFFENLNQRV